MGFPDSTGDPRSKSSTYIMRKTTSSIIIHKGKILLLLRDDKPEISDHNKWQSIGGQAEQGETFGETIRREIKEETSLNPSDIKYYRKLSGRDFILAFYVINLTDKEAKEVKLGNEGQELRFFTLDDIKKIDLSSTLKNYYEKYLPQLTRLVRGETVTPEELGLVL